MFHSDVLVLAGAGVSIPVGIPGMKGMAKEFREDLPKPSDAQKGYDLLRDYGAGSDLEELLELANNISEFSGSELDEFVDWCVKQGKRKTIRLRDYHRQRNLVIRRVQAFRAELLDWLKKACLNYRKERAYRIYGDLISTLADTGIPVFTTNYDGVWEHVASKQDIPVVDNFQQQGKRDFWDESLASYRQPGFRVIKLHGSVYWHASKEGRIEKLDPPSSVNSDGDPVERLIIVPTRFKDIYQRNYFPLYTKFLRTLGQAKTCIVIGHSLRDKYLSAALRDRLRDKDFALIVVDPNCVLSDDLLQGAADPESQIIHIEEGAERLTEVYPILLEGGKSQTAVDTGQKLVEAVRSQRQSSVEIECPHWLRGGYKDLIRLKVATSLESVELKGFLSPNKDKSNRVSLARDIERGWKNAPYVDPLTSIERTINPYLRKGFGRGPHHIYMKLVNSKGKKVGEAVRRIRLKGV